ncbi:hypothetical protein RRG08_060881 [Elysia crispata]|uniref:Uncharacterized protein n=1 Tax=Elysia crispata TaxID=231223 RepID=A0AAE0ZFK6_9GAST|nr:hypothetical protein RRG08_060881 [Elysia crispata]
MAAISVPTSVLDSGYKDRLFEENDSGLGSMPRDLNSLDLTASPLACLRESHQISIDLQQATGKSSASVGTAQENCSFGDCSEIGQTGHVLSLTSGLLNLNLKEQDCDRSPGCPDTHRMALLQQHEAAVRAGQEKVQGTLNSLPGDHDSGNFSITSVSMAATDIDQVTPSSQSEMCSNQKDIHAESGVESTMSGDLSLTRDSCPVQQENNVTFVSAEQQVAFYQGDADGDNCLHLSIIHGHQDLAMVLIGLAPEYIWLSFCNHLRQTPLHLAVLTGQHRLVRRLLCAGAIVDAQDLRGETPLHIACRQGHLETVKNLLTPVHYKEKQGNMWEIPYQRLPQDLGVQNCEGQTPLHVAAIAGHEEVVELLLKAGADPNVGEAKSGRTALHLAAERGSVKLVELLACFHNMDLLKRNYAGLTAAQLALDRNFDHIVQCLPPSCEELSDAESDSTMVGSDSEDDFWDEGME